MFNTILLLYCWKTLPQSLLLSLSRPQSKCHASRVLATTEVQLLDMVS